MQVKQRATTVAVAVALAVGFAAGRVSTPSAQGGNRVYEIRTYTTEGKSGLDALVKRMREGEARIFDKLGMKGVGFFVAAEAPKSENTYIYILAHESREKAKESWAKFRDDPDWQRVRTTAASPGPIKVDSVFVEPLDFSPMK